MNNSNTKIQGNTLKGQEIFIGLEDSKKSWKLCVRAFGTTVKEISMPADYNNLKNFISNHFPECRVTVIYEAGFSGFNLYDYITGEGWKCVVTPAHRVTQEKCQSVKNDRIDSRRLARVLESGDYHSCFVPDRQTRENRQVSRLYEQNLKDIRQSCNRFRRLLEFHGLDRHFKSGRWNPRDYRYAWELCEEMNVSDSLRFSIEDMRIMIELLWERKKRLIAQLKELSTSQPYKENVELLISIPGIGWLTAIKFMLEIGTITRFKRKEQFAKYLGLVPREYSSGERERKGHITKEGSRWIRYWLVECSWIAIRNDPVLLDKYRRVLSHSGSSKKAIVAVARALAIRIRSILITKQKYVIGTVS